MTDRILIIEGEPSLRKELTSALDKASFAAVDVPSFPEALLKLTQFKPDLVIMDVVLPGGDGIGGLPPIKKYPWHSDCPPW